MIYPQVKKDSAAFFNVILNIDYRTITEENFKEQIRPYINFIPNEAAVKEYVKHVKDNEIVIEGKSDFKAPIIYSDGFNYRARIELTFEIKHSKTNVNLLYYRLF